MKNDRPTLNDIYKICFTELSLKNLKKDKNLKGQITVDYSYWYLIIAPMIVVTCAVAVIYDKCSIEQALPINVAIAAAFGWYIMRICGHNEDILSIKVKQQYLADYKKQQLEKKLIAMSVSRDEYRVILDEAKDYSRQGTLNMPMLYFIFSTIWSIIALILGKEHIELIIIISFIIITILWWIESMFNAIRSNLMLWRASRYKYLVKMLRQLGPSVLKSQADVIRIRVQHTYVNHQQGLRFRRRSN